VAEKWAENIIAIIYWRTHIIAYVFLDFLESDLKI
jgi:hypothetical protein